MKQSFENIVVHRARTIELPEAGLYDVLAVKTNKRFHFLILRHSLSRDVYRFPVSVQRVSDVDGIKCIVIRREPGAVHIPQLKTPMRTSGYYIDDDTPRCWSSWFLFKMDIEYDIGVYTVLDLDTEYVVECAFEDSGKRFLLLKTEAFNLPFVLKPFVADYEEMIWRKAINNHPGIRYRTGRSLQDAGRLYLRTKLVLTEE